MKIAIFAAAALLLATLPSLSVAQTNRTLGSAYDVLTPAAAISITRLSDMKYASGATEANIFGVEEDEDLAALHRQIAASPVAQAALTAAGLSVVDVISLRTLPDGTVTLYVDDLL